MTSEEKRQWAIRQLQIKYEELGRLPKKTDYDGATCSRIKAFLGPWHRALENAGLNSYRKKKKAKGNKKLIKGEIIMKRKILGF